MAFSRPFVFLLLVAACLRLGAEEVRIAASDLLAAHLREPLEAFGEANDLDVKLESIGSLPALDQLRSNEVDLGIIAVPEGEPVPGEEFQVYPFAYDFAVVAVNENNPTNEITMARLGGIFGAAEEMNLTSWGDLGLSGWGNRSIKPLAGEDKEGIALELFKYSALASGSMKSSVAVVKENEAEDLLASDAASIAVLGRRPGNAKVKNLLVAEVENGPAYGPTADNIHYGDYPIRLAFYIAFYERDRPRLKKVVRALLNDTVAGRLEANDFAPLPDTVRRKLRIDLDLEEE